MPGRKRKHPDPGIEPTQEEFARAMTLIHKAYQGVDETAHALRACFAAEGVHDVDASFVHAQHRLVFRIRLKSREHLFEARRSGLMTRLKAFIRKELKRHRRGENRGRTKIRVEFDDCEPLVPGSPR